MVQKIVKRSGNKVNKQFIAQASTNPKVLEASFLGVADHIWQSVTVSFKAESSHESQQFFPLNTLAE